MHDRHPSPAATIAVRDPLPVGRRLGERAYVVDDAQLERYLVGIGARDNPWYTQASPYGGPVCPAAILFYEPLDFPGPRQHAPGKAAFNSGAAWEFLAPVRLHQRLRLSEVVADRWLKRGREYAVFQMDAMDEDGRLVARCGFKESWDGPPAYDPPLPSRDGEPGSLNRDTTGEEIGRLSRLYTFEMSAAFCSPRRDLHTDRELARQRGFDDVVIAGPQFVCQMSELMTRIFGRGYYEAGRLNVNFLRPVLAGERITARAAVSSRSRDRDGMERIDVAIWCENDAGAKTAAGVASAAVVDGVTRVDDSC